MSGQKPPGSDGALFHMNGAGNSFLVVDALKGSVLPRSSESRAQFAKRLCRETPGLSADGMVFLDPAADFDFRWDFYNDDGSHAEMCGNAARCMTLFYGTRYGTDQVHFETAAGEIRGQILDPRTVKVWMPRLADRGRRLTLTAGGRQADYFYINTGVPHVVVPSAPDKSIAAELRRAPELGPAGANVTFFEETAPGFVKAVTFERGVEDYTLACGTGATAAAVYGHQLRQELNSMQIQMPGGLLNVAWEKGAEDAPILTGPVEFDFELRPIKGEQT